MHPTTPCSPTCDGGCCCCSAAAASSSACIASASCWSAVPSPAAAAPAAAAPSWLELPAAAAAVDGPSLLPRDRFLPFLLGCCCCCGSGGSACTGAFPLSSAATPPAGWPLPPAAAAAAAAADVPAPSPLPPAAAAVAPCPPSATSANMRRLLLAWVRMSGLAAACWLARISSSSGRSASSALPRGQRQWHLWGKGAWVARVAAQPCCSILHSASVSGTAGAPPMRTQAHPGGRPHPPPQPRL